jgi:hypothetical protein
MGESSLSNGLSYTSRVFRLVSVFGLMTHYGGGSLEGLYS